MGAHDERREFARELDFLTGCEPGEEMVQDGVREFKGQAQDGALELARSNLRDGVQRVLRRLLTEEQRVWL